MTISTYSRPERISLRVAVTLLISALTSASLIVGSAVANDLTGRLATAFPHIEKHLQQSMLEMQTPGMALAITDRDHSLHVITLGFADVKAATPVTPQTLFAIGSIGKSFTAVALLALCDEHKFDFHAPVSTYLPWWNVQSEVPITGHHLVTHTAGIPNYRGDMSCSIYETLWLNELPFCAAPGQRFHYSSNGYSILGHLAKATGGEPYAEVIRAKILTPLAMNDSEPVLVNQMRTRLPPSYVPLYNDRPQHPDDPLVEAAFYEYTLGAGSVCCTAPDLTAYLRMLMNRGQGVLTEKSYQALTQHAVQQGEGHYYGYGIEVLKVGDHTRLRHGGGCFGFRSMLVGDLDQGLGVVLLANGPANIQMAEFALKVVLAAVAGKPLPDPSSPPPVDTNPADYSGTYADVDGNQLQFQSQKNQLVLVDGEQSAVLAAHGPNQFYSRHPHYSEFVLRFGRQQGQVVEVSYGSQWYTKDEYQGPRQFDVDPSWRVLPGHYRATTLPQTGFRVALRKGKLRFVTYNGHETELVPIGDNKFQLGDRPEWVGFDTVIDDKALRADYSGVTCFRK